LPTDGLEHDSPVIDPNAVFVNVDLDLKDLLSMGEDIELPGEVEDLYHNPPFDRKKQSNTKPANQQTSPSKVDNIESTPSKNGNEGNQETPRRSPRLTDNGLNGGVLFNVIRMIVTDTTGIDSRIDVPKILVFSHRDTAVGQAVDDLKNLLQDTSDDRSKIQFDLCKLF
jgi:hypothetical protein